MKTERRHDSYTVTVPPEDVADFASRWPCSALNVEGTHAFTFSSSNGDLLDVAMTVDGIAAEPDHDAASALLAMSEDAGLHGAKELGLDDVLAIRYPDEVASPAP